MTLKKIAKSWLTTTAIFALSMQSALPCTIFSLYPEGKHWVGRTFDWGYGHGLVFTNKRNVTKKALQLLPTDVALTWTSKYGSVTFNQFGREFPTGGMNERGLMVDALELLYSQFPEPDNRPSFNELQFMQYLLDNYSSVEKIAEDLPNIRLAPVGSRLHYFTCDVKRCMTIEFLDGKAVTHLKETLEISGLANNSYEHHVKYARQFTGFGGDRPIVEDSKLSLDRFVRANYRAKYVDQSKYPLQATFLILNDVGGVNNRWQIIYNQNDKLIHFRTTAKLNLQRKVDVSKFNFDCHFPVLHFDLDSDYEGAINNQFVDFDPAVNHAMIKKSVEKQGMPAALTDRLARYPDETICN